MIWATVSSWSCFCWLYRASPSLAAKIIINLISVLTVWWCPCVQSSLMLVEEGVCYDQCVLLANSISLCPASFSTSRPDLPVFPGISWLPTFAFWSPIMKRISFWVLVLEGFLVFIEPFNFSFKELQFKIIKMPLKHNLGWPTLSPNTTFRAFSLTQTETQYLLHNNFPFLLSHSICLP